MHPERPSMCTTGCRVKATDMACPRAFHTEQLWDLFRFTLPRVYAAESTDTQTSTTTLPDILGKPECPETGWERIKELFKPRIGKAYHDEVNNVLKSSIAAALLGWIYGGLPGARHARERFIQLSNAQIYTSRVDAVRSAHNAAFRGFMRFGWRWSWRLTVFVTLFNTVHTGISVYRDKNSISHFATAGAVTGGVFRINLGLRGVVAGSVIGATLGLPVGVLITGLQKLGGETTRERIRRERRELFELKMAEWNARLQHTETISDGIGGLEQDADDDVQRIEELLNLPRNEDSTESSEDQ